MKKYDIISYAADFASFLIRNTDIGNIKEIILFGSASRLEADMDSDVDIFINISNKDPKLEKNVKEIKEQFFGSAKYKNYWKLLGITNNINIIVGLLKDWKLENSIASTGITLYGKYQRKPLNGKDAVLLVWENVKPDSTRVLLNKNILGYKKGSVFYKGLLQKHDGIKLGKGCILIDASAYNQFIQTFKRLKVAVKIRRVFDYT